MGCRIVLNGDEEEELVTVGVEASRPKDGAPHRSSNGVVAVAWARLIVEVLVEIGVGIEVFIAEVVVEATVELVGPALGDEIEVAARSFAVLGLVVGTHESNFLDGIEVDGGIQGGKATGVAGDTIDGGGVVLAVDAVDSGGAGGAQTGGAFAADDTRNSPSKSHDIPAYGE